ncbi:PcfJ domain-containing protein [Priestia megaterium]|uniref:PcfJ domain-containing protein n=1 Tax=Priestia megaterium TaxID=1404 RepID=UPI003F7E59D7
MTEIVYENPFKKDFRIHSHDIDDNEPVDLVHCANCNQILPASVNEEATHKFSCPLCQKRIIRRFRDRKMYVTKVYGKIFHYDDKVVYSCGFYHHILKYCYKSKVMKKLSILYQYNISHNTKTGYTYLLKKGKNPKYNKFANLSLGCLPLQWSLIREHLAYMEEDPLFKEFAKQLLPEWFDIPESFCVNDLAVYLRYPQLGLLPYEVTSSLSFRDELRKAKKKRKELPNLPFKRKAIINWFFDIPVTKREQKYICEHPHLFLLEGLLTKLFRNGDIRYDVLIELNEIKQLKDPYQLYFLMQGMFEANYGKAFLSLRSHFTSEKQFAHHFVRFLYEMQFKDDYLSEGVLRVVEDIMRMSDQLKGLHPDFAMPRVYDIQELHDTLMVPFLQVERPYQEILYTKDEKNKMESDMLMSDFLLAKSNHELIKAGSLLNICVGSYAEAALQKKLYIVLIRSKESGRITHCLEIIHKRGWALVQAKGKYNQIPVAAMQEDIQRYCEQKGITIQTGDIQIELVS